MSALNRALKAARRANASGAVLGEMLNDINPDMAAPIRVALDEWNASLAALIPALDAAVGEYNRVVEVNVDRAQVAVLAESSN